jgi:hypothetical protein
VFLNPNPGDTNNLAIVLTLGWLMLALQEELVGACLNPPWSPLCFLHALRAGSHGVACHRTSEARLKCFTMPPEPGAVYYTAAHIDLHCYGRVFTTRTVYTHCPTSFMLPRSCITLHTPSCITRSVVWITRPVITYHIAAPTIYTASHGFTLYYIAFGFEPCTLFTALHCITRLSALGHAHNRTILHSRPCPLHGFTLLYTVRTDSCITRSVPEPSRGRVPGFI